MVPSGFTSRMVVLLPPKPPPPPRSPPPPPPPRERTWQRSSVFVALSTCPCSMTTKSYAPCVTSVNKNSGVSSPPPLPSIHHPNRDSTAAAPTEPTANVNVFPSRRNRRDRRAWFEQECKRGEERMAASS